MRASGMRIAAAWPVPIPSNTNTANTIRPMPMSRPDTCDERLRMAGGQYNARGMMSQASKYTSSAPPPVASSATMNARRVIDTSQP